MKNPALVLVVEDHPPTLRMISRTLESAGFRARSAGDAVEGVGAALGERPDLILMDIGLPGLDGAAAASMIKEDPALGNIPLVLVSAAADLERRREESGAEGAIRKPFCPADLIGCVRRWVGERD